MARIDVDLCGVHLDNPVIPASGTFGYGYEFADLYDIDVLGSLAFKTTTLNPRYGNPVPRIAETASGMLNAIGLQNPGVDKVIDEELPKLRNYFHKPIVANISGFSIDEYKEVAQRISKEDQIGFIEVNVSCPNVSGGGIHFGSDPALAKEVTKAVKEVSDKPVFIKLSPNVTDIVSIAKACEEGGADGISLINTLIGMRIDIRKRAPIIKNVTGGLSGPAIFPVALRMVYQVAHNVSIPVIGLGGISKAEDVVEMVLAGASAVEVGAANFTDPFICKKIIEELPGLLDSLGVRDIKEIIGGCK